MCLKIPTYSYIVESSLLCYILMWTYRMHINHSFYDSFLGIAETVKVILRKVLNDYITSDLLIYLLQQCKWKCINFMEDFAFY